MSRHINSVLATITIAIAILLIAISMTAQPAIDYGARIYTVATAPTCTNGSPIQYWVSDALSSSSCTIGGGAVEVLCQCSDGARVSVAVSGLGTADKGAAISDNAIIRGDGSRGIQGSLVSVDDSGNVTMPGSTLLGYGARVYASNASVASPNVLTPLLSGTFITNIGAAVKDGEQLPPASTGLRYRFSVEDSDGMRIMMVGDDIVHLDTDHSSGPAGYIESVAASSYVELTAISDSEWHASGVHGEWTDGSWVHSTVLSDGSIYWATPAATDNTPNTPVKCAGTTAAQGVAHRFTQGTDNRITYTGKVRQALRVLASISVSASNPTTGTLLLYQGGAPIPGLTISRVFSNNDAGAMVIHGTVLLAENEYVELWCMTNDNDDLTVLSGVLSAIGID